MFYSKEIEENYNYAKTQINDEEDYIHPLINYSDVLKAHYYLADYFLDNSSGAVEKMSVGVRSFQLLGSAVGRQIVGYGGRQKYSQSLQICSTLFYGLVTDHPFVDGNKRTALLILLYQLQLYGYYPTSSINAFEKLVISVAERSLPEKYYKVYKKYVKDKKDKKSNNVDTEVLTIAHIIKSLTEKVDRSFHMNISMKEFCDTLNVIGVHYLLDNNKIKFDFVKKKFWHSRKYQYSVNFYGWTRPVEARMARDVFDKLGLTEEYPSFQSAVKEQREPFYKLIKDFEAPLKRLKDK